MTHFESRIIERNIRYTVSQLAGIVFEYGECDTAVVIERHEFCGQNSGDYHSRRESNGELTVMIIRNHEAKTIMHRRLNQPLTPESMNVVRVIDLTR
jgi:hypothetical protein